MQSNTYPHLQAFLSGWLHQDFDIVGTSIEAVVDEFKRVSSESDVNAVAKDIEDFVAAYGDQVGNQFSRAFELDIDPTVLAPSVEAFLMQMGARLQTK
jgi:hypothetical protein